VTATGPDLRHPDTTSARFMTRRAWWLVVLGLLIPGAAQVIAGHRRLGRFGLAATLILWVLVVVGVVVVALQPTLLVMAGTNRIVLGALLVVVVFYAVLWLVLGLDTLRLVRFVKVAPNARLPIAVLAIAGLVLSIGGSGFVASRALSAFDALGIFDGGQIAEPIEGRYNILVLGGDAGADRFGLRPDSISVVSVDAETGATVILGLPRNMQRVPFAEDSPLWGPFPGGYDCGVDCLISYLYTYAEEHPELYPDAIENGSSPGIEATRDAVEGVLGLTTQYYVLVDLQGFVQLIDALGGIDIDVTSRIPIEGGEDANGQPTGVSGWIEPGLQHLDGYHALWYARARHGTNDYDRMARQRVVQEAILKQMDPANVLLRFNEIAAAGGDLASTDIPSAMLSYFAGLALKAKEQPVTSLDFVPEEWDNIHPDIVGIQAKVDELLAPPTPAAG